MIEIKAPFSDEDMEKLLNLQFKEQRLNSLNFGDIYLKAMKDVYGDFTQSIEKTNKILHITGKVLPVTLEPITICAELEDGTVIESKEKIPDMVNEKVSKINRIYINPTNCKPAPGVLEAIAEADAIVIGPGSLYTNVIPNLLVKGVSKAIKESKAFKIYVNNIMTEQGQTDNYTLSDHIKVINEHAGKGVIDYCIYDSGELTPEFIRKYNMRGQDLVEIDAQKAKSEGVNLMQRDISYVNGEFIRHNPDAIAASIIQLICDDLKFKDMQNDAKYMLLNDYQKEIYDDAIWRISEEIKNKEYISAYMYASYAYSITGMPEMLYYKGKALFKMKDNFNARSVFLEYIKVGSERVNKAYIFLHSISIKVHSKTMANYYKKEMDKLEYLYQSNFDYKDIEYHLRFYKKEY